MFFRAGRREQLAFLVALSLSVLTTILYAHYRGPGHDWGDDFGLYLQYARNIVEGRPLNDLNLLIRVPPGFPFIMALTAPLHHWDYPSMKLVGTLAIGVFGFLAFLVARHYVSAASALAVSAATVWNGYVFTLQQSIIADLPFAAVVAAGLLAALSLVGHRSGTGKSRYWIGVALPLLVLSAVMIKPAGIAFALAILLSLGCALALVRTRDRRELWAVALALTIAAVVYYYVAWSASTGGFVAVFFKIYLAKYDNPVEGIVSFIVAGVPRELNNLGILMLWYGPWRPLVVAIALAAFCGCLANLIRRRGAAPLEWFMMGHFALLVLTPWSDGGPRYLLPLLPIVYVELAWLIERIPGLLRAWQMPRIGAVLACGAVVAIAVHGLGIVYQFRHYNENDVDRPEVAELIDWVTSNTPPDAIICSFKPRAIMYLARRQTCYIGEWTDDRSAAEFLAGQHSQYLVTMTRTERNQNLEQTTKMRNDHSLCAAFSNGEFAVYRPCSQPALSSASSNVNE